MRMTMMKIGEGMMGRTWWQMMTITTKRDMCVRMTILF